jgi:hypothetical protein
MKIQVLADDGKVLETLDEGMAWANYWKNFFIYIKINIWPTCMKNTKWSGEAVMKDVI